MFARHLQLGHSKRFAEPPAVTATLAADPREEGTAAAGACDVSRLGFARSGLGRLSWRGCLGLSLAAALSWVTPALAADEASDADTSADEKSDEKKEGEDATEGEEKKDGAADAAAEAARAKAEADSTPVEKRGETYYFVGARYRLVVVPAFMMHLFADGGTTVPVHSGGAEFGIRKDNFEYDLGLSLASYAMDPTKFKSKTDADDAWELVESRLKVLYLTADFMWSQPVAKEFAINYGMGAGLGIVFGDLLRTQAYPDPNGPGGYSPCVRAGTPRPDYCGSDNNHYPGYTEPSWASGGSKPIIFPWLAVQTGLRYKPHKKFVGRLDLGFGLSGPFIGIGADYGI